MSRYRSVSPELFRRVALGALVSLAAIAVTGAVVRLTGSGLGCDTWPACTDVHLVAPWEFHAQVEFINRLITFAVCAATGLAVLAARRRVPRRSDLIRLSWLLVGGVILQALVGALVTVLELVPGVVAVHYLLSAALVSVATLLWHRAGSELPPLPTGAGPADDRDEALRRSLTLSRGVLVALVAVLLTGPLVTGHAPHAGDRRAERLTIWSLGSVTRVHSLTVWVLVAALVLLVVHLHRHRLAPATERGRVAVVVVLAQGVLGYVQYFSGIPALLVAIHVGGSLAVLVAVALLHLSITALRPAPVSTPERDRDPDRELR